MITKERLIEVGMIVTGEDTIKDFKNLISNWLEEYYYSDVLEYLQNIITQLELSFYIRELIGYGTIAYFENSKGMIVHIGNVSMSYDSIDELLNELNEFETLTINY